MPDDAGAGGGSYQNCFHMNMQIEQIDFFSHVHDLEPFSYKHEYETAAAVPDDARASGSSYQNCFYMNMQIELIETDFTCTWFGTVFMQT